MSPWKWFLLSFFGGGIAFWISDVVIAAVNPNERGCGTTVACPALLILFYLVVLRLRKADQSGPSTAIFAICGMWILALSFTMLAQAVRSNGGVWVGYTWGDFGYLLISSFVPTRIFVLVGLEGSAYALALGTAAMIICHFAFEIHRWIVPPSLWAALHHSRK